MKLTGSNKNGDRFYVVTGWSGEYTIRGIAATGIGVIRTDALLPSLTTIKQENCKWTRMTFYQKYPVKIQQLMSC